MAEKADEGFTLIETLVVVIVMGLLAAVVTLAVAGLSSKGEASASLADEKTLKKAQEAYFAQRAGGDHVYGEESELWSKRFIATQSDLHDICVEQPAKQRYTVVPAGTDCASVSFP